MIFRNCFPGSQNTSTVVKLIRFGLWAAMVITKASLQNNTEQ